MQSSVHNCYDTIYHELLVNELYEVLDKENIDFIVLLVSFLEAPILDQEGQYYASASGIPQGCPLSQVLMNFYLNLLDKHFVGFECPLTSRPSNEVRIVPIYYARYANLLLFIDREDVVTALASDIVWGTLKNACQYLQVECSWSEINRYPIYIGERLHNNFEVLGLEMSLSGAGDIILKIPMDKWEKEFKCDLILKDMERLELPRKKDVILHIGC